MKNNLREQSRDELRRVLSEMEALAPVAPEVVETKPLDVRPHRRTPRTNPLLVTLVAAVSVFVLALPLMFRSSNPVDTDASAPLAGPATTTAETGVSGSTTPTTDATGSTTEPTNRRSMDGSPEELGVTSIDFVTAILPTSPVEYRESAAWNAIYYNVTNHRFEQCMAVQEIAVEVPRASAMDLRRSAELPDFELDATYGTLDANDLTWNASPPASTSPTEAKTWQETFDQCSLDVEKWKSEGFDQVIGRLPAWFDTIREVNGSAEMADTTTRLLSCVAAGGGPQADSLDDLYGVYNSLLQSAETKDEAIQIGLEMSRLLNSCVGDYNQTRQDILVPKRDQIVDEYADVLAEAKPFFDSVLSEALGN